MYFLDLCNNVFYEKAYICGRRPAPLCHFWFWVDSKFNISCFLIFRNVLRVGINQVHSDLRQGLHLLVVLNMVFPSLTMAKVMVRRSDYVATL